MGEGDSCVPLMKPGLEVNILFSLGLGLGHWFESDFYSLDSRSKLGQFSIPPAPCAWRLPHVLNLTPLVSSFTSLIKNQLVNATRDLCKVSMCIIDFLYLLMRTNSSPVSPEVS